MPCAAAAAEFLAAKSQLRKLRSGLFPNIRFPGWTVEHVRRPSLDEAITLVAQLESCEAGLGRTVMGPSTPKKQRFAPEAAALEFWERIAGAATTEEQALERWDHGRPGLLAAYGLNDQLVAKLAFKAEGPRARKTDRMVGNTHGVQTVFEVRPKRDFGDMCIVGCDGSSRRRGRTLQHVERSLGGNGALPHRRGASASAHRGGNGQGGVDLPLCMRRSVRRTLRLGRGRARPTSSDVRQKARQGGRMGPRRGRSQLSQAVS